MPELKYKPVRHDHDAFLKKAKKRAGFHKAYEALETEYALVNERLSAKTKTATRMTAINKVRHSGGRVQRGNPESR